MKLRMTMACAAVFGFAAVASAGTIVSPMIFGSQLQTLASCVVFNTGTQMVQLTTSILRYPLTGPSGRRP